jgi:hypothetical protein
MKLKFKINFKACPAWGCPHPHEAAAAAGTEEERLPHGGREDERRKKMMTTNGTHMSLRGEEIYVFVYACSWARLVLYLREVKNCNGKFQNT